MNTAGGRRFEVRATGIATRAVGLIVTAQQAEAIVSGGKADMVALARAILDDPHWAWHAARTLGTSDIGSRSALITTRFPVDGLCANGVNISFRTGMSTPVRRMSAKTPTTVTHGLRVVSGFAPPKLTRFPIALSPGKSRSAAANHESTVSERLGRAIAKQPQLHAIARLSRAFTTAHR